MDIYPHGRSHKAHTLERSLHAFGSWACNECDPMDGFRVGGHRWLLPNSPLDLLARERVQSLYLPNGLSLPLLPFKLAAQEASLLPNKRSNALTFAVQIDARTHALSKRERERDSVC